MPGPFPYRLTYWENVKGRGDIVAQTLHLAGVQFEWIDVTFDNLEKIKEDNKDCAFFNLPLFSCTSNFKYTETLAIVQDISLYKKPELIGKTKDDQVQVLMINGVVLDTRGAISRAAIGPDCETKVREALKGIVAKKLGMLANYLKDRAYAVGDSTTLADIFIFSVVELARAVDKKLEVNAFDYSKFDTHFNTHKENPSLKGYLESEARKAKRFLPLECPIDL